MKKTLREELLNQRLALSQAQVNQFSQSLIQQIRKLSAYQNATHVGIYAPIKNEPDLFPLMRDDKHFYLPKVVGNAMVYLPFKEMASLVLSPLGILEPQGQGDASASLELLIIPGIAFDHLGNRIGFGKGFFDRFLHRQRPKHVIGVAYPFQFMQKVPSTKMDEKVDRVLIA